MAPTTDLRLLFPPTRYALRRELSCRLLMDPPLSFDEINQDTSGVDCLVQIIRRTNVGAVGQDTQGDDTRNPILAYAWTDFPLAFSSNDLRQHHLEKKLSLIRELSAKIPSGLSFDNLCNSTLMNETLWSSEDWLLYRGILKRDGNGEWHPQPHPNVADRGALGLLTFDCRENHKLELQAAVDAHFEPKKGEDGAWTLFVPQEPACIRVRYSAHEKTPWPIEKLKSLELPTWEPSGPDGQGLLMKSTKRLRYSLVAVVPPRHISGGVDTVRIYDRDGTPVNTNNSLDSIGNGIWTMNQAGTATFMLFFMLSLGFDMVVSGGEAPAIPIKVPDSVLAVIAQSFNHEDNESDQRDWDLGPSDESFFTQPEPLEMHFDSTEKAWADGTSQGVTIGQASNAEMQLEPREGIPGQQVATPGQPVVPNTAQPTTSPYREKGTPRGTPREKNLQEPRHRRKTPTGPRQDRNNRGGGTPASGVNAAPLGPR